MKLRQFNIDAPNAFEEGDSVIKPKDLVNHLLAHKKLLQKKYEKTEAGEILSIIKFVDELLSDINTP